MNGRVYDPELGRFLSADPFVQDASNAQSWNRYAYVLNNPLSMTDPSGFFFGSIFHATGAPCAVDGYTLSQSDMRIDLKHDFCVKGVQHQSTAFADDFNSLHCITSSCDTQNDTQRKNHAISLDERIAIITLIY
jgi:hypothetical protein